MRKDYQKYADLFWGTSMGRPEKFEEALELVVDEVRKDVRSALSNAAKAYADGVEMKIKAEMEKL